MDEDTISEFKSIVSIHGQIVAAFAEIEGMKLENDNARANGEDDKYSPKDFFSLESNLKNLSNELG